MEGTVPENEIQKKNEPVGARESLFGALLFFVMIIFTVLSVIGIGWIVYTKWKESRAFSARPSIVAIEKQLLENEEVNKTGEDTLVSSETVAPSMEEKTAEEGVLVAAKKLTISVLNGGATKGSAGTFAEILKAEGFIGATAGNTIKDYVGVTVYYAAELEKEAEAILGSVIKKYPAAKKAPAETNNKETSVARITIILGK